jgi:hypothetical protein
MNRLLFVALALLASASLGAWHNGGDTAAQPPKFGTHDYIAYEGLDRAPAAQVAWIKPHLVAYFIGDGFHTDSQSLFRSLIASNG